MMGKNEQLDVLWISDQPFWPLSHGGSVIAYHMIRAMRDQGVNVGAASMQPLNKSAGKTMQNLSIRWPAPTEEQVEQFNRGWGGPMRSARQRVAHYLGMQPDIMAGALELVERHQPQTVIGIGMHSPLILRGLSQFPGLNRVWYGADELVSHDLSCMRYDEVANVPQRLRELAHDEVRPAHDLAAIGVCGSPAGGTGPAPHCSRSWRPGKSGRRAQSSISRRSPPPTAATRPGWWR